ncbi:SGNH/GDSL hydrolase family protein [Corynebacterium gerontici]|uniref:Lipase 2 n=1 Tax=Corynebacterium gerontici TaxID=2079234 RepID=A0A3G6J0T2_9CORY|nr:SGNH/GDSL hydrolase family protein [Corynebacterium gerontici]AZA11645.1 Lipase 2 precursor [Corynebacterium gerontici]
MKHSLRAGVAIAGTLACAFVQLAPAANAAIAPGAKYVALGDSFAAVGSLTEIQVPPSVMCGQAKNNYAHVVAEKLGPELNDVTCGWATTEDNWGPQQHPLPATALQAQQVAVTADTDLVTLTFGGNDNFADKYLAACMGTFVAGAGPTCKDLVATPVEQAVSTIGGKVEAVIRDVQARAPHAKVMVAGYYELTNANVQCFPNVPTRAADREFIADFIGSLNKQLAAAAAATGATFVAALTDGDMCTESTSLLGVTENAVGFHPTGVGQARMADAIIAAM